MSVPNASVRELETRGYCVLSHEALSNNPSHKIDLLNEAGKFQEFVPGAEKLVMGGFAALGNPSSFHNPTVRKLRQWATSIVVNGVFRDMVRPTTGKPYNVEQCMERMTIRVANEKPSAESWHRDESKIAAGDDKVFGGWINLDDQAQLFSCVPGSQYNEARSHTGFATIPRSEHAACKSRSSLVEIPPGHILVFYENIIHEVLSRKLDRGMVRVHLGWRLTTSSGMRDNVAEAIRDQGVPKIKSGQTPPMYAACHFANWIDRLQEWSLKYVHKKCLVAVKYQTGKREGEEFVIVKRHMGSLREYGFAMYPGYSAEEQKVYQPSNSWTLLEPGSENTYVEFSL